jgi:hypothetical protein
MRMDPLQSIELLARRARQETPPVTDISLRKFPPAGLREPIRLFPMACTAAVSALAATVLLSLALHTSSTQSSQTISPLFNVVQVEMP